MLLPRDPQMDAKQNIIICVQYTRTSLTDVQYKQIKKRNNCEVQLIPFEIMTTLYFLHYSYVILSHLANLANTAIKWGNWTEITSFHVYL